MSNQTKLTKFYKKQQKPSSSFLPKTSSESSIKHKSDIILEMTLKEFLKFSNIAEIVENDLKKKFPKNEHHKQLSVLKSYINQLHDRHKESTSVLKKLIKKGKLILKVDEYLKYCSENNAINVENNIIPTLKPSNFEQDNTNGIDDIKKYLKSPHIDKILKEYYNKYKDGESIDCDEMGDEVMNVLKLTTESSKNFGTKECFVNLKKNNFFNNNRLNFYVDILNVDYKEKGNWDEVLNSYKKLEEQNNYNIQKENTERIEVSQSAEENVMIESINTEDVIMENKTIDNDMMEDETTESGIAKGKTSRKYRLQSKCTEIDLMNDENTENIIIKDKSSEKFMLKDKITEDMENERNHDGNEIFIEETQIQTQNDSDLNLSLTSRMFYNIQRENKIYGLLNTIHIAPKQMSFEDFVNYTNIEEYIFKKLKDSRKLSEEHISKIKMYMKAFYKKYFESREHWPSGVLLEQGSLKILLKKIKTTCIDLNKGDNRYNEIPEIELPAFFVPKESTDSQMDNSTNRCYNQPNKSYGNQLDNSKKLTLNEKNPPIITSKNFLTDNKIFSPNAVIDTSLTSSYNKQIENVECVEVEENIDIQTTLLTSNNEVNDPLENTNFTSILHINNCDFSRNFKENDNPHNNFRGIDLKQHQIKEEKIASSYNLSYSDDVVFVPIDTEEVIEICDDSYVESRSQLISEMMSSSVLQSQ